MEASKYTDIFVDETEEDLDTLNGLLLSLEDAGYDEEVMHEAYRVVHTLKGNAGVLGLDEIADVAHAMEDVFDLLRSRGESPDPDALRILFEGADVVGRMASDLAEGGSVATSGRDVEERLRALCAADDEPGGNGASGGESRRLAFDTSQEGRAAKALEEGGSVYDLRVRFEEGLRFKEGRAFQLVHRLADGGEVIATAPDTDGLPDDVAEMRVLLATDEDAAAVVRAAEDVTGIEAASVQAWEPSQDERNEPAGRPDDASPEGDGPQTPRRFRVSKTESVRVKSKLLDELLDLVGEIMINDIRGSQMARDLGDRELLQLFKSRNRLVGDLQHTVLRMRMVPMDYVFRRFPRMVRDMAKESGKAVDFTVSGNDIEIDRGLLDSLGDALVHLLRNAVDHGIEPEDGREAAGKPPRGSVALTAERRQSDIVITVEDDGRGWDLEKIAEKAVARGVLTAEEARSLPEDEVLALAFHPGVSTAERVTEYSGRGVGLDAVKNTVEAMGGKVTFRSRAGRGTEFTLKLPPSVAIISTMLVEVNGEHYGVPMDAVRETARLPIDEVYEFARDGVFRLRGEVLPLINVHEEFGGSSDDFDRDMPVLIVERDEQRAGLVVSDFLGQQEVVVKTLGKELSGAPCFSGATILGDGRVAMILDVGVWM